MFAAWKARAAKVIAAAQASDEAPVKRNKKVDEAEDTYAEEEDDLEAMENLRAEEAELDKREEQMSTTRIVSAPVEEDNKKKRKADAINQADFLIPPLARRNERTPGGTPKPPGVVFRCTYDCSYTLAQTLANLSSFFDHYPLTFTQTGLEMIAIDATHSIAVQVVVPRAAFACYENLHNSGISVAVSAKSIKSLATSCSDRTSLSFLYDQIDGADSKLNLQLYPRIAAYKDEPSLTTCIQPLSDFDNDEIRLNCQYQYRVFITPQQFVNTVRKLSNDCTVLSLVPCSDAFEMAAISSVGTEVTIVSFNSVENEQGKQKPADEEKLISETLTRKMCVVQRLAGADEKIGLAHVRGYKLSAKYMRRAALIAGLSSCKRVSIDMGAAEKQPGTNLYRELPLRIEFHMRAGERGQFIVQAWVTPKYNDDDNDG